MTPPQRRVGGRNSEALTVWECVKRFATGEDVSVGDVVDLLFAPEGIETAQPLSGVSMDVDSLHHRLADASGLVCLAVAWLDSLDQQWPCEWLGRAAHRCVSPPGVADWRGLEDLVGIPMIGLFAVMTVDPDADCAAFALSVETGVHVYLAVPDRWVIHGAEYGVTERAVETGSSWASCIRGF